MTDKEFELATNTYRKELELIFYHINKSGVSMQEFVGLSSKLAEIKDHRSYCPSKSSAVLEKMIGAIKNEKA